MFVGPSVRHVGDRGGSSTSTLGEGAMRAQGLRKEASHRENFVGYIVICSFGIIQTYNQQIFIPDVQLHSPKISLEEGWVGEKGSPLIGEPCSPPR